jgi:UDP-3-O-[3-hydroxymyristoyl] glucosamine N-acyltransferase
MTFTARELADQIGAILEGDAGFRVTGCASHEDAAASELIFVDSEKHLESAARSRAVCLVVTPDAALSGKALLRAANPKLAFAKAAAMLHPPAPLAQGIHPTAIVAASAKLGEGVALGPYTVIEDGAEIGAGSQIGPYSFVGRNAKLGAGCRLHPRVTIYEGMRIGARALIHSGVVIGADGFGLVFGEGHYFKFPQIGTVEIGDDVEIGANTTIDRGALGATRLGNDVKLDNLVHIAHNVQIGDHTAISAQTGIAGSSTIGSKAIIGGQVGIGDHCHLEDGAILGSKCGILPGKIVRGGVPVWGIPAKPLAKFKEVQFWHDRLPDLAERLKALEANAAKQDK